jgi:hypothetical protein
VTVTFSCADAESDVDTCTAPVTVSAEGVRSVTGKAVDNAGNITEATVGPIRIDRTAPTITFGGVSNGGRYTLGALPHPTCTASDPLVGSSPGSGVSGDCTVTVTGSGVGNYTYSATVTDNAGNAATASGTFRVVYSFSGFLQPINDPSVGSTPTSIFKGGSTIPVKFQLTDASGAPVQAGTAGVWVTPVKGSATTSAVDESVYSDTGTAGGSYRWDATSQQYIYNWSTKGVTAGYYYRLGVTLDDGQTYDVTVGLR